MDGARTAGVSPAKWRFALLFKQFLLVDKSPIRPRTGWTRRSFAKVVEKSPPTVGYWCKGSAAPETEETLETIIRELYADFPGYEDKKRQLRLAWRAIDQEASSAKVVSSATRTEERRATQAVRIAEAARIDVSARIRGLSQAFYGRVEDIRVLDRFVTEQPHGIAVVAAPAGSGKSALLAHWQARRRAGGDAVICHFISKLYVETTDPVATLRHLVAQLSELEVSELRDATYLMSANEDGLKNELVGRLASARPPGQRLIIVLDGVDELSTPLKDIFVRETLAKNVFVVVSGRAADASEAPSYLRLWLSAPLGNVPVRRVFVGGLCMLDVAEWIRGQVGDVDSMSIENFANLVHRITDGYPLFMHFLIADFCSGSPPVLDAREIEKLIDRLPDTFGDYIGEQLEQISRDMGAEWTRPVRKLFALLTRTRGPISQGDIEGLFEFYSQSNHAFAGLPPLTALDARIVRWLSIRQTHNEHWLSFAHPRLADAFAQALGREAVEAECQLLEWMDLAWRPRQVRDVTFPGAAYPLDWLPYHLITEGSIDSRRLAANLVSSPTFIAAQLSDPGSASRRLRSNVNCWNALEEHDKLSVPDASNWSAFWAQNETTLLTATASAVQHGVDHVGIVLDCLGDADTRGSDPHPPPRLALLTHPPRDDGLARSVPQAHNGSVQGLIMVEDHLVSWGGDGSIKFWTLSGTRVPGGDDHAHSHLIRGVRRVENRFISWDIGGIIRFWTLAGVPIGQCVSDRAVCGILWVEDRLVSWHGGGAVHFWTLAGERLNGGDDSAHGGSVESVIRVEDRLVSWGGAHVRFWTLQGEPIDLHSEPAHDTWIMGLLKVEDRLVTWDFHGAIRFWSLLGERLDGGDDEAHRDSVNGLLRVNDQLVSWDDLGVIRFWSLDGKPLRKVKAHAGEISKVRLLENRLVSCSEDGAMRVWSLTGERLTGGDDKAHEGTFFDVVTVNKYWFSYGHDGVIRFWTSTGEPIDGYDLKAHLGWVGGLIEVKNRLVSWGRDGAIRFFKFPDDRPAVKQTPSVDHKPSLEDIVFSAASQLWVDDRRVTWTNNGALHFFDQKRERIAGGDERAHNGAIGGVILVERRLVSWGDDGALRFWSLRGSPLPGGSENAFDEPIKGVLRTKNGLVAWGGETIRLWSSEGVPKSYCRYDLDGIAHLIRVLGVLETGKGLVSWGEDNVIRFWTLDGMPIRGVDEDRFHPTIRGVMNLGDRLVSWGGGGPLGDSKGALRFWTLDGDRAEGGSDEAHDGAISLIRVEDRLVSWATDGAIRFWSLDGAPAGSCGNRSHSGSVLDVLPVEDNLISYGDDGTVRVWQQSGKLRKILVPPGGIRLAFAMMGNLWILGPGRLWRYSLSIASLPSAAK
jgi:WD40 repeat protein